MARRTALLLSEPRFCVALGVAQVKLPALVQSCPLRRAAAQPVCRRDRLRGVYRVDDGPLPPLRNQAEAWPLCPIQGRKACRRYHFDWALGNHRVRDALGFDLPDDAAARAHAEAEIRELLATTMGKRLDKDCAIEVLRQIKPKYVQGELQGRVKKNLVRSRRYPSNRAHRDLARAGFPRAASSREHRHRVSSGDSVARWSRFPTPVTNSRQPSFAMRFGSISVSP